MHKQRLTIPKEIYYEFQYLLKQELDFIEKLNVLDRSLNVNEDHKQFLKSNGTHKFIDLINANDEQIEAIFQRKDLFQFIIEVFSKINLRYVYSFAKDHKILAPSQAREIIATAGKSFLSRPINLYLYPIYLKRIKRALDVFEYKTYVSLISMILQNTIFHSHHFII